ncbi:fucose-binding protein [bacterium]|nr:fucose-binding protein [bacterium]
MLKGIDQRLSAEIVHVLMLMGHGDDLVICDVNHPAAAIAKDTTHGKLVDMPGCNLISATEAILSLMPLDTFVPAPVARMQVVGARETVLPLFTRMEETCSRIEGRPIRLNPLERFDFYASARRAFAIVRTSDSGPYGCFILKKGVIDLPPI